MSNALAIATVTATLSDLVRQSAQSTVSGADVIIGRPQPPLTASHRVFLYLYHVGPHTGLRNEDLPTRSGENVRRRPQAALVLHYLLVFQGTDADFEPERMLGAVVRDLYAHPVLSRQDIQAAVNARSTLLDTSNLAEAVERIRLTPLPLSLEDLAKLWSVFFQTPHAVSLAYEASVVVIEGEDAPRPTMPVLFRGSVEDRGVTVVVGPFPQLHSVYISETQDPVAGIMPPGYPSATLGRRLLVRGDHLAGKPVRLRFRHTRLGSVTEITVPDADVSERQLVAAIPLDPAAAQAWSAGMLELTVLVGGTATEAPRSSNSIPLPLAPIVQTIAPAGNVPRVLGTATLTITCTPDVHPDQRCSILVGGREVVADARTTPVSSLSFAIRNAPALQEARLQLRVDDVDSMPFRRVGPPPAVTLEFDPTQTVTIV